MEPGLGLEERTEQLLRRSQSLLSAPRPRPAAPPRPTPDPAPGDPLLQWRLRRQGAGPGRGLRERRPSWGSGDSQEPLWREPCLRSCDPQEPEREAPSWGSRDTPEASRPVPAPPRGASRWEAGLESRDTQGKMPLEKMGVSHQPPPDVGRSLQRVEPAQEPWGRAMEQDVAISEQELLDDPILKLLRGRRRALRGRLRAVETLLAALD